jgi:hypothetical protein
MIRPSGKGGEDVTRKQPPLPDTDAGHEERLRRVQRRTVLVFATPLAQEAEVVTMGTQITARFNADGLAALETNVPDHVQLAYLATLARPFTLANEAIHYAQVARSLLHFAKDRPQIVMSEQLLRIWGMVPAARLTMFRADAGQELLPGGATDGQIADRVLYSQLVHADDSRALLDQVGEPMQQMALAGMVGDWVAIIAHQQYVLQLVRPDLVPELVTWPGTPKTVFERWGQPVVERGPSRGPVAP